MEKAGIKWIGEKDVRRVLTWERLMPAVKQALGAFSRGPDSPQGAVQPLRTAVPVKHVAGTVLVMPGLVPAQGALATKIVSLFPGNAARGEHTHHALVVLLNPDNGSFIALLEGGAITELRTAAASAVATLELATVTQGGVVAVLGAGTQAKAHARVMAHVLKPRKLRVWSRRASAADTLVAELRTEGIACAESAASVRDAVTDADVINTCTLATSPILKQAWVKVGAHINSVGAPRPDWQELAEGLVNSATIYADSRVAAQAEAGDLLKAKATVHAEIGEVINGTVEVKRGSTTIFKSLGLAVEDAVSARLVYDFIANEKSAM